MLELLLEFLWSRTLSAPSFGRYWKQLIGRLFLMFYISISKRATFWKAHLSCKTNFFVGDCSERFEMIYMSRQFHQLNFNGTHYFSGKAKGDGCHWTTRHHPQTYSNFGIRVCQHPQWKLSRNLESVSLI